MLKTDMYFRKISPFFSFLFVVVFFFILSPQPISAAETASNCWVTDFGTPPNDYPLPETCARRRIQCGTGYLCAYKNLVNYYSIGSGWGPRQDNFHEGVDIMAYAGEKQYALEDSIVVSSKFEGCNRRGLGLGNECSSSSDPYNLGKSTGWHVKLFAPINESQTQGRYHFYMHQSSERIVQKNQIIRAGTFVGYTNTTGNSPGGPHLHYQISRLCNRNDNSYGAQCWSDPKIVLQNWPNY